MTFTAHLPLRLRVQPTRQPICACGVLMNGHIIVTQPFYKSWGGEGMEDEKRIKELEENRDFYKELLEKEFRIMELNAKAIKEISEDLSELRENLSRLNEEKGKSRRRWLWKK